MKKVLVLLLLLSSCLVGAMQREHLDVRIADAAGAARAYSPIINGNQYVAEVDANNNSVSVFAVNQATGAFTQVAGSPFVTGVNPNSVTFSLENGDLHARVINSGDGTVSHYLVNPNSGAFMRIP